MQQHTAASSKKLKKKYETDMPIIRDELPEDFSVSQYATKYQGKYLISRLTLLAELCPGFALDCYRAALEELVKTTYDVNAYKKIYTKYKNEVEKRHMLTDYLLYDEEWVEKVTQQVRVEFNQLEHELIDSKASLMKNSIRLTQIRIGELRFKYGDLTGAKTCFGRLKEVSTSSEQLLEMYVLMIKTCIGMQDYSMLGAYLEKVKALRVVKDEYWNIICFATAIMHLENREFRAACDAFLNMKYNDEDDFEGITNNVDIGIYGGLCGLATLSREEIKEMLIDSKNYCSYRELDSEINSCILDFYDGKYKTMSEKLSKIISKQRVDMITHNALEELYRNIRYKIIRSYIAPKSKVDLNKMVNALVYYKEGVEGLIQELVAFKLQYDQVDELLEKYRINEYDGYLEQDLEVNYALEKARASVISAEMEVNVRSEIEMFKINLLNNGMLAGNLK